MKKLKLILNQLEQQIPNFEKTNPSVSNATIGWHIDHSLLVINAVINQLKKSNPADYKWKINLNRILVQDILKKIPRGKGKAPKKVQPFEEITQEYLKNKLKITQNTVLELSSFDAKNYFKHPYFGDLKLTSAIHFIEIHTKHHLKIIEDILEN